MTRTIVDPRLLETMADYFPSLCTIQEDVGIEDAHGMIAEDWQTFAGHADIPCAVAATGGQEVKQTDQTYVVANFKVALRGFYETITEKMRAVVTGANAGTYDILLVESSSHSRATRLMVNEVE